MSNFTNKNIAVYVTGSVACYKSLKLIRLLKQGEANVKVIMSNGAQRFIKPLTFQAISGRSVIRDQVLGNSTNGIPHVDLARWTDVAIVMPATANIIAKAANGIADGVVSTCLLATSAPKIMVPAMNNVMYSQPSTQRNIKILNRYPNYYVWGPVSGKLAEGYSGKGRMLEPQQVISRLNPIFNHNQPLKSLNILVTAGGTQEAIDPVRFITNGSSGKMGYSIARQAQQMGAHVTLVSGHASVSAPANVKLIRTKTTEDMLHAVLKELPKVQVLIMAAALADFEPIRSATQKIKKDHSNRYSPIFLKLKKAPDVLSKVAEVKRPNQVTIGFAAETQNLVHNALHKLKAKRLDLIVANDVANPRIGFGTDNNQVTFIDSKGRVKKTPVESKMMIAKRLLKIVAKLKDDRS